MLSPHDLPLEARTHRVLTPRERAYLADYLQPVTDRVAVRKHLEREARRAQSRDLDSFVGVVAFVAGLVLVAGVVAVWL